jgi:hypothetical protein
MNVGLRLGIAVGIGAAGGIALGLVNDRQSTASSFGQLAVGTGIAGMAGRYMLTGPSGRIAPWAAAVGATIAAAGLTSLFRGPDTPGAVHVPYNPAEHQSEQPTAPHTLDGPPTGTTTAPPQDGTEAEVETYGADGEWVSTEHGTLGQPPAGTPPLR